MNNSTSENLSGASVKAVSASPVHSMCKPNLHSIMLVEGSGVEGDAHSGPKVKHRSRVAKDPSQPNLRQVHLIHSELHDELRGKGFTIAPGQMGENITTSGVDLLSLPEGTELQIGAQAVVKITGLRNPCYQLDGLQPGLMQAVLDKDSDNNLVRKAGIMGIVIKGGLVQPSDEIHIVLPSGPHQSLGPV